MSASRQDTTQESVSKQDTVRVFVGASPVEYLAFKVLEHSIRKHTAHAVEMTFMHALSYSLPKARKNQPATNFSFYRFMIPALTGYEGKAVYMDSDMLVFRDIAELWNLPFEGAKVLTIEDEEGDGRTIQQSVLLLNCGTLDWSIERIVQDMDEGKYDYSDLMRHLCIVDSDQVRLAIPSRWNSHEKYEPGETGLLHYTRLRTQPWVSTENPLSHLWVQALLDALDTGFITRELVAEEVRKGHARPSLLAQVDQRCLNASDLPKEEVSRDQAFIPPYRRLQSHTLLDRVYRRIQRVRNALRPAARFRS